MTQIVRQVDPPSTVNDIETFRNRRRNHLCRTVLFPGESSLFALSHLATCRSSLSREELVALRFAAFILGLLTLTAIEGPAIAEQPASRTNVVIVLADDLGWGDLGCYGHPRIKTPNLDKFASQGLRFTQCYSAGAVCSPSRSAIQTGRTPYRNGVFTWIPENRELHLRRSEVSLATLLHGRGYETCHVGKWHLNGYFNDPRHPQPNDHGYDWWMATQNNAGPSHKNPTNFVRNGQPVGPLEGYSAPLVVDEAVTWLRTKHDATKPFFLTVWTHEPHLPIESEPLYQELYRDLDDADVRQHHGNVTQLDAAFGKLMLTLEELKLTDETFVFFTSDNGPEGNGTSGRTRGSTGGLRGRKRSVYEGGIRVPGIARWPGHIPAGKSCDVPVIGSDLFATACEIAGAKVPSDRVIDGVSIVPTFNGGSVERVVPLYWRCNIAPEKLKTAMRVGDWKIVAAEDMSAFELYNLAADPHEERELSAAEPKRFAAMQDQLKKLNAEIEAEGPDWWKNYNQGGKTQPKKSKESKTSEKPKGKKKNATTK